MTKWYKTFEAWDAERTRRGYSQTYQITIGAGGKYLVQCFAAGEDDGCHGSVGMFNHTDSLGHFNEERP